MSEIGRRCHGRRPRVPAPGPPAAWPERVPWPAAFAAATNRHLQQTLNLNWKCLTEPQNRFREY